MKAPIAKTYRVLRMILVPAFALLFRFRVNGQDNLPSSGPYIICANHVNALDCVSLGIAAKGRQVHFMAKSSLWNSVALFGIILDRIGAIPVNRDHNDLAALRRASQVLKQDGVLGIFPEGTRMRGGQIGEGMPGTAYLAVRNRVPVVPCRIKGRYRLFSRVEITIGKPLELTELYSQRASSEALAEGTHKIMERIRDL